MGRDQADKSYREQEIQTLCHECGEAAAFACADCRQPRCDAHRDSSGARCLECSVERTRALSATVAAALSVLGGLALAALFLLAPPATVALGALWVGLVGQVLGLILALAVGRRSSRRRRLAQLALIVSSTTLPALVALTLLF